MYDWPRGTGASPRHWLRSMGGISAKLESLILARPILARPFPQAMRSQHTTSGDRGGQQAPPTTTQSVSHLAPAERYLGASKAHVGYRSRCFLQPTPTETIEILQRKTTMKASALIVVAVSGVALAVPGMTLRAAKRDAYAWKDLTSLDYDDEIPVAKTNLERRKSSVPVKDNRDLIYSNDLPLAREARVALEGN